MLHLQKEHQLTSVGTDTGTRQKFQIKCRNFKTGGSIVQSLEFRKIYTGLVYGGKKETWHGNIDRETSKKWEHEMVTFYHKSRCC